MCHTPHTHALALQDLSCPKPWRYDVLAVTDGLNAAGLRHVTGEDLLKPQVSELHVGGTVADWPIEGVMVLDPVTSKHGLLVMDSMLKAKGK